MLTFGRLEGIESESPYCIFLDLSKLATKRKVKGPENGLLNYSRPTILYRNVINLISSVEPCLTVWYAECVYAKACLLDMVQGIRLIPGCFYASSSASHCRVCVTENFLQTNGCSCG